MLHLQQFISDKIMGKKSYHRKVSFVSKKAFFDSFTTKKYNKKIKYAHASGTICELADRDS